MPPEPEPLGSPKEELRAASLAAYVRIATTTSELIPNAVTVVLSLKDLERAVQYRERARIKKLRWFLFDSDSILKFVCEELEYSLPHIRQRANEILIGPQP